MLKRLALAALMALAWLPAMAAQETYTQPTSGPLSMHDYSTGLNATLAAVLSCNSGTSAPDEDDQPADYQCWIDTSATPAVLKRYDGSAWVTVGAIDATNHLWIGAAAQPVNAQSGTSYTVDDGDRGELVTLSNSSPVAVTLPEAGDSDAFIATWWADLVNLGAGTVTVTPTTSTINGASSLTLATGQGAHIVSDGTNYIAFLGKGGGSGTVTSVTCGTGLSGGAITTSGTCTLDTGNANSWSGVQTLGDGKLVLSGASSGSATLKAPASGGGTATLFAGSDTVVGKATTDTLTNKTFDTAGTGNSFKINGTAISAVSGSGAVVLAGRALTAGTGLSGGGDLSADRTIDLEDTAVSAGSYGDDSHVATFTVDAQGRLTDAGEAAIPGASDFTGDSGSGGVHGLVPAPGAGDAAAGKYLKADGAWDVPSGSGSGDVVGPSSAVDGEIALFDGTTGKLVKSATGSGIAKIASGVLGTATSGTDYAPATSGSSILKGNGSGGFSAASAGTDYAAPGANSDITSVLLGQAGLVVKGATSTALTIKPNETLSSGRTLNLVTGDASRTLTFAGDATISGTNTGDQTSVSGNAGTATALATARAIYGNNFDGSAALTQVIASTYGGTGNGFTKFSGPASTEKTFTLPNATATLLYDGGALGTPASGTLTNATGLPVSGITASTSTALGVGSVELGHASDTTLSRGSSGVLAVEGVTVPTISSTNTLTNKRVTARIGTTASSSTPTPDADSHDQYNVTALAAGATFGAPSGTPTDGQKLIIRIKDNGTARTLAWNAIYRAGSDVALPTTTVISKTLYVAFIYNAADSKWDLVAVLNNI